LFIFGTPEILDFFLKTTYERFIARELYFFNFSHKMPVVIVMTIVVTKHAPVIHATSAWFYVCKIVLHHLATLVPHFFFKYSAAPLRYQRAIRRDRDNAADWLLKLQRARAKMKERRN
jgi:hypothetical protein